MPAFHFHRILADVLFSVLQNADSFYCSNTNPGNGSTDREVQISHKSCIQYACGLCRPVLMLSLLFYCFVVLMPDCFSCSPIIFCSCGMSKALLIGTLVRTHTDKSRPGTKIETLTRSYLVVWPYWTCFWWEPKSTGQASARSNWNAEVWFLGFSTPSFLIY